MNTFEEDDRIILDTSGLVADIAKINQNATDRITADIRAVSAEQLAYAFHVALADAIANTVIVLCEKYNVTQVVFSGGTFYNRLLLGEIYTRLENTNLKLYINEQVPSGDGGLALGQLFLTL